MRSERPKPLHPLCGRPMVGHVIEALIDLEVDHTMIVVGFGAQAVEKQLTEHAPDWARLGFAEQVEQRGTGHATRRRAVQGLVRRVGEGAGSGRAIWCLYVGQSLQT